MTAVLQWIRRRPLTTDAGIAVLAAAFEVSTAALEGRSPREPDLTLVGTGLLLVQTLPLVWRSRHPYTVAMITGIAAAIYGIREYPDPMVPLGPLIALYTIVAISSRRQALIIAGLAVVGVLGAVAASGDSDALDVYLAVVLFSVAWILGDQHRTRAAQLAQRDAAVTAQAVDEERARIARELHDVVAHHVSMMVVQAEAGASVADAGPAALAERFDAIGATGRQTLGELRRLLGVLREDAEERSPTAPQPRIDHIPELVRQVNAAGLPVDVSVEGTARPLPSGLELSAYRIVQEALTNTLKHAGPAHAEVVVRYADDALELEISDDGRDPVNDANGGHGLIGLRERVALYGGSLQTGRREGHGFVVSARLPFAGS